MLTSRTVDFVLFLRHRLWFQQPYKSCLLKVMVTGQGFSNAALAHYDKTSAVHEAPFLVLFASLSSLLRKPLGS